MSAHIRCLIYSQAGDGHRNEDIALVRPHPAERNMLLCALADGQGGRAGGAEAARLAAEESLRAASSFPAAALLEALPWYAVLSAADEAVGENDLAGFCSLVSLCVSAGQVCGASCGDSAALLLSGGSAVELTEQQRKNPPVGSSAARPVAFSARLQPGWEQMAHIAARHQGQATIDALRQAALVSNGGRMQDDFSVVLLSEAADIE